MSLTPYRDMLKLGTQEFHMPSWVPSISSNELKSLVGAGNMWLFSLTWASVGRALQFTIWIFACLWVYEASFQLLNSWIEGNQLSLKYCSNLFQCQKYYFLFPTRMWRKRNGSTRWSYAFKMIELIDKLLYFDSGCYSQLTCTW